MVSRENNHNSHENSEDLDQSAHDKSFCYSAFFNLLLKF